MAPEWFDPLGIRGSRLDPLTLFADAVRGEGLARQSVERLTGTLAQSLVERRVEIETTPPVHATVERVVHISPVTAMAAMPTVAGEVPLWRRVCGGLRDVRIGSRTLERVELDIADLRLGALGRRLRITAVEFHALASDTEVQQWVRALAGDRPVRLDQGRLEISDRRVVRWAWLEVEASASAGTIVVTPVALRVVGRVVSLPGRLRRPSRIVAPWLPDELVVDAVMVAGNAVTITGRLRQLDLEVDLVSVLVELATGGTRSVLRVVAGAR
jgi:hypothetical protein